MDLSSFLTFIGRLHPVLVHLPIGILLAASFFQLLTIKKRFVALQSAIPALFFCGMLASLFSCITGYWLSLGDSYDPQLVGQHQWMGIAVFITSLALCLLYGFSANVKIARIMAVVITVLVSITGHLGGSLTHGADYLTGSLMGKKEEGIKISNIQEAVLYDDIVQPLLQAKCYSCHGESKQKGKLRLDKQEFILKGGEEGEALKAGKADESPIIERALLPTTDEDHMPPKEKPQLTKAEILILQWWINSGADFTKKVKELPQTDAVTPALSAMQFGVIEKMSEGDVPAAPVDAPNEKAMAQLKEAGVVVQAVADKSHYLLVSFATVTTDVNALVKWLPALKEQIIWLKIESKTLSDASLDELAKLTAVTRLSVSHSSFNDSGLAKLNTLQHLQSLNLVGTKVTAKGILSLGKLANLKNLYLYCTEVKESDWQLLTRAFPSAILDLGNYQVPTFANDTTVIEF